MTSVKTFFSKPFFTSKKFIPALWFGVALIASVKHIISRNIDNNYIIFKYVFIHTREQLNLFSQYPYYHDCNHYGPIFSLIIAPFTFFPDYIGCVLWGLVISFTLYKAIALLPLEWKAKVAIYYIAVQELFISISGMQTNPLIVALIIGSFIAILKEKDLWGSFFIMLGTFIKLYGIVGLCFFFFSKHKLKFAGYLLLWGIVFFVLPMAVSSPQFIIQSYQDWYQSLIEKNLSNAASVLQDISVMGMIRRILDNRDISNFIMLVPALLIFALQYLRISDYKDLGYQLGILASTLLFVVLFSSGSESQTYIIAMTGVGIWFVLQDKPYSGYMIGLLVFALLLTSFSPSDIVPREIRLFIRKYALKALPCFFIWLVLVYQVIKGKFCHKFNYTA